MKTPTDHFSNVAEQYATCRPGYPPKLFSYLAELSAGHDLAWDCAAGSGQATIPLAATFRQVLATDISESMLARAPRHPAVVFRVSRAQESGLPAASVDLVTVAQALHWLDLDAFYAEVDRVLRPGATLAVWSYATPLLGEEALDSVLSHFYSEVVGPYWPTERRQVEVGYRSLPFPYDEIPVPQFAMEERWILSQLLGYVGTWSATQRFRAEKGFDPVIQLAEELRRPWGDRDSFRTVRWPLSLRAGHKPK
jgi:SAM-dependent methyltransferase